MSQERCNKQRLGILRRRKRSLQVPHENPANGGANKISNGVPNVANERSNAQPVNIAIDEPFRGAYSCAVLVAERKPERNPFGGAVDIADHLDPECVPFGQPFVPSICDR